MYIHCVCSMEGTLAEQFVGQKYVRCRVFAFQACNRICVLHKFGRYIAKSKVYTCMYIHDIVYMTCRAVHVFIYTYMYVYMLQFLVSCVYTSPS